MLEKQKENTARKGATIMMDVKNMPLQMPTNLTIGSITTGTQPPQGEVFKLNVTKSGEVQPEAQEKKTSPLFGTHIKEGIAVVKDWMKKS